MNAQRFFETAFPQMVIKHFDTFLQSQGTISFAVEGQGDWTVEFGNSESPIADGFQGDADLRLWWSGEGFSSFLDGKLDVIEAVQAGDVSAAGNVELLETLGYMLRPQTTLLDIMMHQ